MQQGPASGVDLNQSITVAQREHELEELEDFEGRWWSGPVHWKPRIRAALRRNIGIWFALREARRGVARYGNAIAEEHGVSIRQQRAALFAAALKHHFHAEDFYLYQIYHEARRRAIRSFISKERLTALLEYLTRVTQAPDCKDLRDKRLFRERGVRHGLPTIPVLAEFDKGEVTPRAWQAEEPLPSVDLFAKVANLWAGINAKRWVCVGEDRFCDAAGNTFRSSDIVAEMRTRSARYPQVLQPRVRNHTALDRLSRGGLCTVRLVTCRQPAGDRARAGNGDGFDFLPPVLRMPTGDSVVDNFAQGGLAAPIDSRTGKLSGAAVRRDPSRAITTATHHPDTQERLEGFELPFWPEMLALGLRAHAAFPSMQFIAWDIAFLDSGPILVEGNVGFDSDLTQLPHGNGLGNTQFVAYYNQHIRAISRTQ